MGAWIETGLIVYPAGVLLSHPMWVRGLKLSSVNGSIFGQLSHPMWVRGLKLPELL